MTRARVGWVVAVLCLVGPAAAREPKPKKPPKERHDAVGAVVLNGVRTPVRWTDGDSFQVKDGPWRGRGTRLTGYNTLEAYGPVHAWGDWTPAELAVLANGAAGAAAAQEWACTTAGKEDGYHRLLVDCAGLAEAMVRDGHALAYAVEGERAPEVVLAAQREAQLAGRGIWRKGVVKGVVTSVHSLGEDGDEDQLETYNRVVDTRTGQALKRPHKERYQTCQVVCLETDGDRSCMVYVPFRQRYRQQPACLR